MNDCQNANSNVETSAQLGGESGLDIKQYRKKPVIVEAVQLTPENAQEVVEWCGQQRILIPEWHVAYDSFVLKTPDGKWYSRKPSDFAKEYEPKEQDTQSVELLKEARGYVVTTCQSHREHLQRTAWCERLDAHLAQIAANTETTPKENKDNG